MLRQSYYDSPIGKLILLSENEQLLGIWFADQQYMGADYPLEQILFEETTSIIATKSWLNAYFSGENPNVTTLQILPKGTDYRQKVWQILVQIPYGETITYKEIAQKIAEKEGKMTFSAQAVGGAVGHNPLSIVIPCHRVIGSDGSLTGYAGGIERKQYLLNLERAPHK